MPIAPGRSGRSVTTQGRSAKSVSSRGRSPKQSHGRNRNISATVFIALPAPTLEFEVVRSSSGPPPEYDAALAMSLGLSMAMQATTFTPISAAIAMPLGLAMDVQAVVYETINASVAITLAIPTLEVIAFAGDPAQVSANVAMTLGITPALQVTHFTPINAAVSIPLGFTVAVQATTFAAVFATVSMPLSLTIAITAGAGAGGAFTADFVSNSFTGCSASDFTVAQAAAINGQNHDGTVVGFAANTKRLTSDGWQINSASVQHVGANALSPNSWTITAPGWTGSTKTSLGTLGAFQPIRYQTSNATSGAIFGGVTTTFTVGEVITVKWRIKHTSAHPTAGFRALFQWSGGSAYVYTGDASAASPTFISTANHLAVQAIIRNGDGTLDVVIRHTVQGSGLDFGGGPHVDTTATIDLYGRQVRRSSSDGPWQAVGASTVTVAADVATISPSLVLGPAWAYTIDYGPPDSQSGELLGFDAELARVTGYTSVACGSINAAVGMGGHQGVGRVVISGNGSVTKICANGGVVQSGAAISTSGGFRVGRGISVKVRKISGTPVLLSDAQMQQASTLIGQNFVNAGNALVPSSTWVETFFDDFTSNTIRTRTNSDLTAEPVAPDVGPLIALYNTPGYWMPRYIFNTRSAEGGGPEPINQEYQEYMDPQRPGNYNPFSISNSILTITAQHYNNLPSGQKALVDIDQNHGGQYQYVSGALVTAGKFAQLMGYFEARMKLPSSSKLWPAFWALPTFSSVAELDVVETIGNGDRGYDTSTMHWDNYASNPGVSKSWPYDIEQDFHTYGALWQAGSVKAYRDGVLMGTVATAGNFDQTAMYLLLNLAVGGSWPGTPDAATLAAMPAQMQVDYVRVHRLS